MKIALLVFAGIVAQTVKSDGKPTLVEHYINQPDYAACESTGRVLPAPGSYVALLQFDPKQQQPLVSAVAIALPVDSNGRQAITIAYPFTQRCPFLSELIAPNGRAVW